MNVVLFAFWFFLPAGLANGAPVIINNVPWFKKFNKPIDGGRKFRGKQIFGPHKTWRGLISGTLVGFITAGIQMILYANITWLEEISRHVDYSNPNILFIGALLGFGALAGDAIESFFKRQRGLKSGEGWFPFDQIDYIIGAIVFVLPFVSLSLTEMITILIFWSVIHPFVGLFFWVIKMRDKPF